MPSGRISIYTPELVEKAWKYVNGGWKTAGDKVPSVEGLCDEIGIAKSTAYVWAKDEDKVFSDVLDAVMAKQGRKLINGGLSGDFAPTITRMMMGKHGYSDRQEVDNTSSDGSMSPVTHIRNEIVYPDKKGD